jgi:hypothetical protein
MTMAKMATVDITIATNSRGRCTIAVAIRPALLKFAEPLRAVRLRTFLHPII